ncbi:hypothetical protein BSKO_10190 [Bryopsis sp. KO-2023]|nr:hypothetical protein BSKO_10190 [Bryopsis sp. KO-2023]
MATSLIASSCTATGHGFSPSQSSKNRQNNKSAFMKGHIKFPQRGRADRGDFATTGAFFPWQKQAEAGFSEKRCYGAGDLVDMGPFKVSPMGFGTWAWGNKFLWEYSTEMDGELQQIFNLLVSKGINVFDTADSYGTGALNGRSEQLLGKFMEEYPGSDKVRDNIRIATKFAAYPWRVLPANMVAACKGSLRRLNSDKLSLGQLHWSASNYAPLQEIALWNGLADCYEQGLVDAVGVSNYGPKELKKLHKNLASRGVPLASAQVQFSLLSFGKQQMELLEVCRELNVAVISYSPLGLGLLTGKFDGENVPKGPRGALFKQLLPKIQPLLGTVNATAKERGKTPSQVAINWCIQKGTVPIPGAKNLSQAEQNLGALGWSLRRAEVEELDRAVEESQGKMVQNIFQTG